MLREYPRRKVFRTVAAPSGYSGATAGSAGLSKKAAPVLSKTKLWFGSVLNSLITSPKGAFKPTSWVVLIGKLPVVKPALGGIVVSAEGELEIFYFYFSVGLRPL